MKPLDPKLLKEAKAARWFIASVVAFAILAACSTMVFSWQLAFVLTQVFVENKPIGHYLANLFIAGAFGLLRAIVVFAQDAIAARASSAVKAELRQKFNYAIQKLGVSWLSKQSAARLNLLSTNGLDSLDAYFAKYLPQLIYTVLITPVFVFTIAITDQASGWVLIATIPLIPIFMILIGWATQKAQNQQLSALTRLSQHFLEALRGLTTLRVFNRAQAQVEILRKVSEEHRVRTMKVLRISFLSGFALELLASLSVALIAVSIGLRLVNGEITLFAGLFILLLAPEAYLPLRMVGAQFHASSEGIAASGAILQILEESEQAPNAISANENNLLEKSKFNVLVGPSGSGKTTLMNGLLDLSDQGAMSRFSWMPQQAHLFEGTVRENIIGPASNNVAALERSIALAALDDLHLDFNVGETGARVSGGQAQRIALARCFYRAIDSSVEALLLDEPISAIDAKRAAIVASSLRTLADQGFAVLAISHQDSLESLADRIIEVPIG